MKLYCHEHPHTEMAISLAYKFYPTIPSMPESLYFTFEWYAKKKRQ